MSEILVVRMSINCTSSTERFHYHDEHSALHNEVLMFQAVSFLRENNPYESLFALLN